MKVIHGPILSAQRYIICLLAICLVLVLISNVKGPDQGDLSLKKDLDLELTPGLMASGGLNLAPDHPSLLTYMRDHHLMAPPSPRRTVNIRGPLDPNVDKEVQQEIARFILNLLDNKVRMDHTPFLLHKDNKGDGWINILSFL